MGWPLRPEAATAVHQFVEQTACTLSQHLSSTVVEVQIRQKTGCKSGTIEQKRCPYRLCALHTAKQVARHATNGCHSGTHTDEHLWLGHVYIVNHPYLSHSTCALILDLVIAQVQLHQPLVGVLLQCLTDPART